ncbi:MAG TPA: hypothetical protein VMQ50_06375 [Casimicrobiaceae bacterium]|nr:hypothetical protein [Casimicrobiaceae bacterium]
MRKILLFAVLAPLALPGCQTETSKPATALTWGSTWSEVTGNQYVGGVLYRRPSIIEHIDNRGAFNSDPIKVEPGKHQIQVSAPVPGWPGGSDIKVMELDLQACKRYYINAQFENNVSQDWSVVVGYVDTIAGCKA